MNTIVQNFAGLNSEWTLSSSEPAAYSLPADFVANNINKIEVKIPSTVAQAYQKAGLWSLHRHCDLNSQEFDNKDWWYQTRFKYNPNSDSSILNFMGLATLCEVWLNDIKILSSQNMFVSHQVDVAQQLQVDNDLVICFRSLSNNLSQRRPRPRWKTKLVNHQQLRWIRTSLLGRIPGWTPPVAPVGPWQPIFLQAKTVPFNINLKTVLNGSTGLLEISCQIISDEQPKATLSIGNNNSPLEIVKDSTGYTLSGKIEIENVKLWWPHTHGQPHLYTPDLSLIINNQTTTHPLAAIGFKNIHINQDNNNFQINVNKQAIFCRGTCWTINDIVSLRGNERSLEQILTLMRDAGANMIRIGGTMIYEQELFYQLCDELGIMIWQDFMFANMDYPIDDVDFRANVELEIQQTIKRLRQHVCISIYCGNSEIEQQAAMLGLPENEWKNSLFTQLIPDIHKKLQAEVPYITSTPTGDILPFHTNKNVTHYYGVGAYQRPVSELRQHNVKFASECLGFANVPMSNTRDKIMNGQLPVTHHPKWKERIPRDTGSGWDFADVRDHYTKNLFNIDPVNMRCFDSENYITLSEITTGEIMYQVYSEWRSAHSQCTGGLMWFLKDFWQGAGWGIIDSNNIPKACYYYLKRCWQPINVVLTNETLNGIDIHVINESAEDFNGQIEIFLLNRNSTVIANETINIKTTKLSTTTYNSDELLKNFYDITYSYRFGSVKHSIVAVLLKTNENVLLSDAFYFPNPEIPYINPTSKLTAVATEIDEHTYELELSCNHFLYAVNIEVNGYTTSNNFFHMLPNRAKRIILKKIDLDSKRFKGYVGALNLSEDIKISIK